MKMRIALRIMSLGFVSSYLLSGCASSAFKARKDQRETLAIQSGHYCEFVSGDQFPDVDVQVNILMAQKCESKQPVTITSYRNSAGQNGIMYCCNYSNRKSSDKVEETRKKSSPVETDKN